MGNLLSEEYSEIHECYNHLLTTSEKSIRHPPRVLCANEWMNEMKPAAKTSHNETRGAELQNLRPENSCALGFDYERNQEGFPEMR